MFQKFAMHDNQRLLSSFTCQNIMSNILDCYIYPFLRYPIKSSKAARQVFISLISSLKALILNYSPRKFDIIFYKELIPTMLATQYETLPAKHSEFGIGRCFEIHCCCVRSSAVCIPLRTCFCHCVFCPSANCIFKHKKLFNSIQKLRPSVLTYEEWRQSAFFVR